LYEKPNPSAMVLICFAVNVSVNTPLTTILTALAKFRPDESNWIVYFSVDFVVAYIGSVQDNESTWLSESAGVGAMVVVDPVSAGAFPFGK
jgi:hypothetical protein